ncbi:Nucleoside-diphosphate-sugar epimerase [Cyclobacterium xiamenense]|uniref:Nucleoside-diphosphate-sugar epimerase n=1 Tax=Cyclobacterium xiamenense TaxID=1297121 RepID=A0A1H6WJ15_9BACT|nr:D-erythronate dehydrogenase [Cyclobacterium xiamenense]SEJ17049.1 Nucleoside-diphosphate-sugar epimerase [Cyclobacterium xiamenense]
MHVLIIGGGGFIGSRLASEYRQQNPAARSSLTLFDRHFPETLANDPEFDCVQGDFGDPSQIDALLDKKPDLIFHLAAVVSGEAEKNFDLGMEVNLNGSLHLLEKCRELGHRPRIVFASSCGIFGGDVRQVITEETAPKPRSSYGTQKAIVDLLMNDYSRRGFVDARCLRLPTITVRPGKPNAATSSFLSSIIREPLNGQPASYPVDPTSEFWILSPKQVVKNFLHAASLSPELIGDDRTVNLPGLTVSVQHMIDCLERVAGPAVAKRISHQPDAFLQSIVLTWPPHFDTRKADALGFTADQDVEEIIRNYIREENIQSTIA